ncbi:MAG: lipoyl(octanoyl) transferase LipB [Phycisphaerae bacterium]|nr:lipoyl(octanoyl) transferase LipB [Phycisphaerae bacterium]
MIIEDLGVMPYRQAWDRQETCHADVLAGGEERMLLVEHPPVITFGRRPGVSQHLIASDDQLARLGVEVVQSDRGGDITFHGPGQLVVYPIVRLADHHLSVSGYVRALERGVIGALNEIGIRAREESGAIGVWTDGGSKICALGVRIRRGVTLHGIALNVTTNLDYFQLIVPCGLVGRSVTSIALELGERAPTMDWMKNIVPRHLVQSLAQPATLPVQ